MEFQANHLEMESVQNMISDHREIYILAEQAGHKQTE